MSGAALRLWSDHLLRLDLKGGELCYYYVPRGQDVYWRLSGGTDRDGDYAMRGDAVIVRALSVCVGTLTRITRRT